MSVCPCLSACLPVCLPVCLSASLSVCQSACLPVCLPACLPLNTFVPTRNTPSPPFYHLPCPIPELWRLGSRYICSHTDQHVLSTNLFTHPIPPPPPHHPHLLGLRSMAPFTADLAVIHAAVGVAVFAPHQLRGTTSSGKITGTIQVWWCFLSSSFFPFFFIFFPILLYLLTRIGGALFLTVLALSYYPSTLPMNTPLHSPHQHPLI